MGEWKIERDEMPVVCWWRKEISKWEMVDKTKASGKYGRMNDRSFATAASVAKINKMKMTRDENTNEINNPEIMIYPH